MMRYNWVYSRWDGGRKGVGERMVGVVEEVGEGLG